MKKLGLALGVGAARGFAHLGVLQALLENGIKPDFIAGGSMGSLVGGMFALNADLKQVEELVADYRKSDLYVVDIPSALTKAGIAKDKRFIHLMSEATKDKNIEDCEIPYRAVAVDLYTGEQAVMCSGPLWQAIRASCSIPGVLVPVEREGMLLVDGGLLNRVPTDVARAMGGEVVIGVDVLGDFRGGWKAKNALDVIMRSFEIVDKRLFHAHPEDYDIMLTPSQDSVDAMKFNKHDKAVSIEAGRRCVLDNLAYIRKLLEG